MNTLPKKPVIKHRDEFSPMSRSFDNVCMILDQINMQKQSKELWQCYVDLRKSIDNKDAGLRNDVMEYINDINNRLASRPIGNGWDEEDKEYFEGFVSHMNEWAGRQ